MKNQLGEGSTFSFDVTLPVAGPSRKPAIVANASVADAPNGAGADDTETPAVQPLRRILVAEDNAVNQLLIKKIAARYGWTLTITNNGEEAVQRVENDGPFDVILMDIRMPVMDGVAATKAIKAMTPEKASTPIIALTANTGADSEVEYRKHGIAAIVGKPIDAALLYAAVEQWQKPKEV